MDDAFLHERDTFSVGAGARVEGTHAGMDDLTDDELLAEAIADVALDVLTRLDGEARGEFLQAFMRLAVEHGGAETAELLRLDPH